MFCGRTPWPWFGTCWWGVEWDDTPVALIPWYWTNGSNLGAFQRVVLLDWAHCSYYGRFPMSWPKASWGQLLAHRNCWSHHRQLMLSIFCTTSRIVYVCGSPANANWTSSRFAIHMFAPRALPIKNTLEPMSTATPIGSRSISQQDGGILPDFFSCTPMLLAQPKGMPRPYDYFRGSVFVWNRLWRSSLKIPCFISPPQGRWRWLTCYRWELSTLTRSVSRYTWSSHWIGERPKLETSSRGSVCAVPTISAEVNVASTMPFFGPGAAATDASACSVGWCY